MIARHNYMSEKYRNLSKEIISEDITHFEKLTNAFKLPTVHFVLPPDNVKAKIRRFIRETLRVG